MRCATQREGTASLLSLGRRDLVQIAQSKEGGEGERSGKRMRNTKRKRRRRKREGREGPSQQGSATLHLRFTETNI